MAIFRHSCFSNIPFLKDIFQPYSHDSSNKITDHVTPKKPEAQYKPAQPGASDGVDPVGLVQLDQLNGIAYQYAQRRYFEGMLSATKI